MGDCFYGCFKHVKNNSTNFHSLGFKDLKKESHLIRASENIK
jgi:hypothetical protein